MLGLLALDARLAGIVRAAREPIMGQLRLAWWRDMFARPVGDWPAGEPLLGLLRVWSGETSALGALVDGWEEMLAEPPLEAAAFDHLAVARAGAFAALARMTGHARAEGPVRDLAYGWALADLALKVSDPAERGSLTAMASDSATVSPRQVGRMPRALRSLVVLHGLAWRALVRARSAPGSGDARLVPSDMFFALRLGLLGR